MRLIRLLVLFLAGFFSSLVLNWDHAFAASGSLTVTRTINDSLVQDLSCHNLTVDSIYNAIRADAFHESRNIPLRNWAFRSGLTKISGCWALSSTQRMFSYLARYNTSSEQIMSTRVTGILDMVRGEKVLEQMSNVNEPQVGTPFRTEKLKTYSVFAVEDSNLLGGLFSSSRSLWSALREGYYQQLGDFQKLRSFREEIEANQANHFFRPSNVRMTVQGGARSVEKNRETWALLKKNLDGRRLTLLNLRGNRLTQHVVMAKSYHSNANGLHEITVYDSNFPGRDATVYFDSNSGQFTAPLIFSRLLEKPQRNLGVYIVDEAERVELEKAMLAHYSSQCR